MSKFIKIGNDNIINADSIMGCYKKTVNYPFLNDDDEVEYSDDVTVLEITLTNDLMYWISDDDELFGAVSQSFNISSENNDYEKAITQFYNNNFKNKKVSAIYVSEDNVDNIWDKICKL